MWTVAEENEGIVCALGGEQYEAKAVRRMAERRGWGASQAKLAGRRLLLASGKIAPTVPE